MRLDENGDGKVTKEELPERMQRVLQRGDANGDGAIDREEAERLRRAITKAVADMSQEEFAQSFREVASSLGADPR